MNSKELIKILKKAGFQEVSQKGSHLKMKKDTKILIVPEHGKKDIPIGTLKSIIKQAGLK